MPNYRYNAPEYTRRNNCGRTMPAVPAASGCHGNMHVPCHEERPVCNDRPVCSDRTVCDEMTGMPIAMAYVPWQEWRALYEVEKGFHCGTIFEELNKPFRGTGGCCK